jgi:cation diffusion facilitator family transporter
MAASSKRALFSAMAANIAIAVTKFIIGGLSHSTVMIAEAIHSLVDTGNSSLMLVGRARSRRGPDSAHPFGHGMELYFWSFLVAMVIFGGGACLSIYRGVIALLHPHALAGLWPSYAVIGAAAVFEGGSLLIGWREFAAYRREKHFEGSMLAVMRESKNPAIFVTVLEDLAALAGLGVAAVGLTVSHLFHAPRFDAAASIVIGVILMLEAALLGVETRGLITGEAARPILLDRIREIVGRHAGIGDVSEIRTLQLGPDAVLLLLGVRPRTAATTELQVASEKLTSDLRAISPTIKHVAFYSESAAKVPAAPGAAVE